jgi:hypothetical protein
MLEMRPLQPLRLCSCPLLLLHKLHHVRDEIKPRMAQCTPTRGDLLARERGKYVKLLPVTGLHKLAIDEESSLDILG